VVLAALVWPVPTSAGVGRAGYRLPDGQVDLGQQAVNGRDQDGIGHRLRRDVNGRRSDLHLRGVRRDLGG